MSENENRRRGRGREADDDESLLVRVEDDDNQEEASEESDRHDISATTASSSVVTTLGWKFERMTTIPYAWGLIVVNLIMIGLVFLIPGLCDPTKDPSKTGSTCLVDPLSSLIYSHAIHWTLHLVADQYLKHCHKISRCRGYIEFYLNTKNLRRTPFYMVSIGNAVLLLTVTALHDYCDHETSNCPDKFTKVDYLRGLITLECMTIGCIWVSYIMNVRDFHRKSPRPDIYREEFIQMVCPENTLNFPNERSEPSARDVLEKQAELIRCVHEYVTRLNEKMSAALCSAAAAQNPNQVI